MLTNINNFTWSVRNKINLASVWKEQSDILLKCANYVFVHFIFPFISHSMRRSKQNNLYVCREIVRIRTFIVILVCLTLITSTKTKNLKYVLKSFSAFPAILFCEFRFTTILKVILWLHLAKMWVINVRNGR